MYFSFKVALFSVLLILLLAFIIFAIKSNSESLDGEADDLLSLSPNEQTDNNVPLPLKKNLIFCIILTTPERLKTRGLTVLYVWVSKCSNYRFVTMTPSYLSHPDNSSTLKKSPFNLLHPRGLLRDNYWELTNKVYYAFRDIYEEFGDQYDWYLKADG